MTSKMNTFKRSVMVSSQQQNATTHLFLLDYLNHIYIVYIVNTHSSEKGFHTFAKQPFGTG